MEVTAAVEDTAASVEAKATMEVALEVITLRTAIMQGLKHQIFNGIIPKS